ncbi:helix-turn-helix domain-containing protein [Serratia fonticola]|uniref:helix-turn-helix domain-containing protein n=1 Tax=Serratia fonticola TaxID=47917 RepID=UPI00137698CD|nr:LuxR C-terminal-related transcriptional regulator [Serratia fonticola]NCG54957.1 hypothetical protein [Serratia fonticola]
MINADTVFIIQPIGDWNGMRINSLQRHQSLNAFFNQLDDAVCFASEVPLHRVPTTPLTLREKAVLAYYSFGYTNIKIGQLLGINQKTVSAHKVNAMKKLNFTHKGDFRRWITAMAPFFPSTEKSDARILKRAS